MICKCPDEYTGDTCEIGLFKKFFSKVARTSQSKVNNFDQISQLHKKKKFITKQIFILNIYLYSNALKLIIFSQNSLFKDFI